MAIGNGDPGGASTEGSRPERAGQDAVELLHQEGPHSIANQLKEAAEFWEVFDDQAQPPSPDGNVQGKQPAHRLHQPGRRPGGRKCMQP